MQFGQQRGKIKNACWDRSHGQPPLPLDMDPPPPQNWDPPDMGPPRIGTPQTWDPPRIGTPPPLRIGTPLELGSPLDMGSPLELGPIPLELGTSGEDGKLMRKL